MNRLFVFLTAFLLSASSLEAQGQSQQDTSGQATPPTVRSTAQEVVLDMVFQADGTVQVNGVISGLGHGLDEAAVRAAQQIKFKPAKRDGQPIDFPARVRIEFRLAY